MKNIYKNGDSYYKMVKPPGGWLRPGCQHYALWQPVKKILWFYIPLGEKFYLDTMGFERV